MNNAQYGLHVKVGMLEHRRFSMEEIDELLTRLGWSLDCHSPLKISHHNGSKASGVAATIVIDEFRLNFMEYCNELN